MTIPKPIPRKGKGEPMVILCPDFRDNYKSSLLLKRRAVCSEKQLGDYGNTPFLVKRRKIITIVKLCPVFERYTDSIFFGQGIVVCS